MFRKTTKPRLALIGGGIGSFLGVLYLGRRYFRAVAAAPTPTQDPQFYEDEEKHIKTPPQDPQFYEDEEAPPAATTIPEALNTVVAVAQEELPTTQAQQVTQAAAEIQQAATKVASPAQLQAVTAATVNLLNQVDNQMSMVDEKRETTTSPEAIPALQRRRTRSSQQKPATGTTTITTPRVIAGPKTGIPKIIVLDTVVLPKGDTAAPYELTDLENQVILKSVENYFLRLTKALRDAAAKKQDPIGIIDANLQYYDDKEHLIRKSIQKYLNERAGASGASTATDNMIRQANADLASRMLITQIIRDTLRPLVVENTANDTGATLREFENYLVATHLPKKLKLAITAYEGVFPGGFKEYLDWFGENIWKIPPQVFVNSKATPEEIATILEADATKNSLNYVARINALMRRYFQSGNRVVGDIAAEKATLVSLKKKLQKDRDKYFAGELARLRASGGTNAREFAELTQAMAKNQLQLNVLKDIIAQFKAIRKEIKNRKPRLDEFTPVVNILPDSLKNRWGVGVPRSSRSSRRRS